MRNKLSVYFSLCVGISIEVYDLCQRFLRSHWTKQTNPLDWFCISRIYHPFSILLLITVGTPSATTSRKRPLFQNTKISPVKSLLVWNVLLFLTSGKRPLHMIRSHYMFKLGNERPYNPEMTITFVITLELFISDIQCSLLTRQLRYEQIS